MNLVYIIALLAIVQYFFFTIRVGGARIKYGVKAPAIAGHEMFERALRVQMNTLEQLIAFLPVMLIAAQYWAPPLVAAIGLVYLVGRFVYWLSYMDDPAKRSLGFLLTFLPTVILGSLGFAGAIRQFW